MMAYPRDPGWKASGTSKDFAQGINSRAKTMRTRILAFLPQHLPSSFTANQIAAGLGESILARRPRVSELRHSGLIESTGERRTNKSGLPAQCRRAVVTGGQA